MSVVSGGKIIFCEGKATSLDYQLLNKVVDGILGKKCTIIPAGSKFSFSSFAEGYFSRNQAVNQKYIVFRDRDFDVQPTPNCQLLQLGNRSINLTYRACVENYLLDPNLIHTYWVESNSYSLTSIKENHQIYSWLQIVILKIGRNWHWQLKKQRIGNVKNVVYSVSSQENRYQMLSNHVAELIHCKCITGIITRLIIVWKI